MICPKYCICFFKKLHLASLSFNSASLNFMNRLLRCSRWVSISGLDARMSSKYPKAKVSPDKTLFTNLWKYTGAYANSNGHLLNSHLPNEETKALLGLDFSDNTM